MVLSNCWKELSSCLHDGLILLENTRHKFFLNHWIKNGSILRIINLMTGFTKETQKEITSFLKKLEPNTIVTYIFFSLVHFSFFITFSRLPLLSPVFINKVLVGWNQLFMNPCVLPADPVRFAPILKLFRIRHLNTWVFAAPLWTF